MFIVSGISIWLVLQINVISQGGSQSYQSFIAVPVKESV